jgi:hypothetical protein
LFLLLTLGHFALEGGAPFGQTALVRIVAALTSGALGLTRLG